MESSFTDSQLSKQEMMQYKRFFYANIIQFCTISGCVTCNSYRGSDLFGPKFVALPSYKIRFSNSSGTELHCRAEGNPEPVSFNSNQIEYVRGYRTCWQEMLSCVLRSILTQSVVIVF